MLTVGARHHGPVRPRLVLVALLAACAVAAAASCTLVTDFDRLRSEGTGEGGGGAPPAPCAEGLVRAACAEGAKCTLTSPAEGTSAGFECGPRGTIEAWSACEADAECADGTWCDAATGVCKPWCSSRDDCPSDAACVSARRGDGTAIAGLTVCTAHCLPTAPQARCGADATCVLVTIDDPEPRLEGDCAAAGDKSAGCLCQEDVDCKAGLRCDVDDGRCRAWCTIGGTCAGGAACDAAVETYAGNSYGQCDPPTCFNN